MTDLYVAKRSGILREPDGTLHRLVAGKTLAAGSHPAVTNSPDSWRPMTIDLDAPGASESQETGDEPVLFYERMTAAEAERDRLVVTLTGVVEAFDRRGLFTEVARDTEGWLVLAVEGALSELDETLTELTPEPPVVVAAPADPETPEGRQVIREWAWAKGLDVSERGTIPKAVLAAYEQAHA